MILDGNSFSSRLPTYLSSGSLLFRAGLFAEWFDERIHPLKHYLPVRSWVLGCWVLGFELERFVASDELSCGQLHDFTCTSLHAMLASSSGKRPLPLLKPAPCPKMRCTVQVRLDFSDLRARLDWALLHDEEAHLMADAARRVAHRRLRYQDIQVLANCIIKP